MRLIDADVLKKDIMAYKTMPEIRKAICEVIDNAPSVENITVFCENADEKTIEELKAELKRVITELRPQGEWGKWVISEIRCPNCLGYFQTDCYSTEELKKCPNCGADMRKGGAV